MRTCDSDAPPPPPHPTALSADARPWARPEGRTQGCPPHSAPASSLAAAPWPGTDGAPSTVATATWPETCSTRSPAGTATSAASAGGASTWGSGALRRKNAHLYTIFVEPQTPRKTSGCISWQNQDPTITFDFGSSVAVTQVRVFGTAAGGGVVTPDRIIVESSPDNSVWTSQADTGVLAAGGSSVLRWAITMDVDDSARYWRLLVTRGGEWTSIGEVEIIGVN